MIYMAKTTYLEVFLPYMRILFCDDDSRILEQLQKYVCEFFADIGGTQPEFAAYSSGDELLARETHADIAFFDVEMPGRIGIKAGAALKEKNPRILIFIVTSYPDYLDEALRENAFRFLSKPIDKSRLFRNLKDAMYKYNMETKEIPVETEEGIELLKADDIVCVEAVQRKTLLYTADSVIQTNQSVEFWQQKLDLPCFYSSHRGVIINMRYVSKVSKDTILLKYGKNVKEVYLARRKYKEFKDLYLLYLESTK